MDLRELGLSRMPLRADGTAIDWAAPIRSAWDFSEGAALRTLREFLADGAPPRLVGLRCMRGHWPAVALPA